MNKISFYLARPQSRTNTVVLVRMKIAGNQVRFGSGVSVLPKDWNGKKQRVRSSANNAVPINKRLDRIETDLTEIFLDLQNNRIEPTPERVKARYDALLQRDVTRTSGKTYFDYWDEWLKTTENEKTESTRKQYRSVKARLEEYQEKKGAVLTFERMDREFFNSFTDYLLKVHHMQNATIWNQIKRIKAFMGWAVEEGLTTNREYEKVTQKAFNVQPPIPVRLTEEELRNFADHDFTDAPYLDNARNLFVLQSCLGVRVSDLLKIVANPAAYREGNNIRLTTQKNKKAVMIPFSPLARKILDGENPPHHISDVKLNKYLKEAAKRAGLDRLITRAEFRGTKREDVTLPLHEEIATHCAKRTFVSLMAARGVSRDVLKAITGNTDKTLDRYLHLDESEIEREMRKAADILASKKSV